MQSIPLMKPLQVKEIKQLGSFLDANRGEEGMNLTVLHGFLCGVLSAPEFISQNDWYPYLFDEAFAFTSQEQTQTIVTLLSRLNNQVIFQLDHGMPFDFIFYQDGQLFDYQTCPDELLSQWCSGYLEGTGLSAIWQEDKIGIVMLLPFSVLANEFDLKNEIHSDGSPIIDDSNHRKHYKQNLVKTIAEIVAYWLPRRLQLDSTSNIEDTLTQLNTPKPHNGGRNDPCICGSGRKFKKCCMHKLTYH